MKVKTCSWCGNQINLSSISAENFELEFEHTTYSDIFGGSGWGFRASGMCLGCGSKLFHELKRLGIKVEEHDW